MLTYDDNIPDNKSAEFAKVKPRKVNEAMKLFSEDRFNVDVLKVEVPVNMNFVEGFTEGEVVYTKEEADNISVIKKHDTFTLYLFSAGVSELFQETLTFAHDAVHISMVCYVGVRHGLVQLKFILNKENKRKRMVTYNWI